MQGALLRSKPTNRPSPFHLARMACCVPRPSKFQPKPVEVLPQTPGRGSVHSIGSQASFCNRSHHFSQDGEHIRTPHDVKRFQVERKSVMRDSMKQVAKDPHLLRSPSARLKIKVATVAVTRTTAMGRRGPAEGSVLDLNDPESTVEKLRHKEMMDVLRVSSQEHHAIAERLFVASEEDSYEEAPTLFASASIVPENSVGDTPAASGETADRTDGVVAGGAGAGASNGCAPALDESSLSMELSSPSRSSQRRSRSWRSLADAGNALTFVGEWTNTYEARKELLFAMHARTCGFVIASARMRSSHARSSHSQPRAPAPPAGRRLAWTPT